MTVKCSRLICKHRTRSFPIGSWGNPNGNEQSNRGGVLPFPLLFCLWHFARFLKFTLISLKPCLLFSLPYNSMKPVIISLKRTFFEYLYASYNVSVETPASFISFCKLTTMFFKAPSLCAILWPVRLCSPLHHVKPISNITSSAKPLRTSTFAFITLRCNCLFTHLFPQLDSALSEVGNLVLFNFAASCWLLGSPEPERWPTLSKYVTLWGSFPASALAPFPPLGLIYLIYFLLSGSRVYIFVSHLKECLNNSGV